MMAPGMRDNRSPRDEDLSGATRRRRAAALRENLRKRKLQARARAREGADIACPRDDKQPTEPHEPGNS
jgi:hypothetical protein